MQSFQILQIIENLTKTQFCCIAETIKTLAVSQHYTDIEICPIPQICQTSVSLVTGRPGAPVLGVSRGGAGRWGRRAGEQEGRRVGGQEKKGAKFQECRRRRRLKVIRAGEENG